MRPWKKVIDPSADHLVLEGNDGDRSELQVIYFYVPVKDLNLVTMTCADSIMYFFFYY